MGAHAGIFAGNVLDQGRGQHHVASGTQMRKQVEALKNHANLLAQLPHGTCIAVLQCLAVHAQTAPLEGFQPVDAAQQRALARAALANDADHFLAAHLQVDALEHFGGPKTLVQAADVNERKRRWDG